MPQEHTISLDAAQIRSSWDQRDYRPLPPDPQQKLDADVTHWLYVARRPNGILSIRITADAVSHLAAPAIWRPLEKLFPLPENVGAEVQVVHYRDQAALLVNGELRY
jgi:hypothetical protein